MKFQVMQLVALLCGRAVSGFTSRSNRGWVQRTAVERGALIFSPDGDYRSESVAWEQESHSHSSMFAPQPVEIQDLAESLSRDSMATLCRLAVVFSPASRKLELSDIDHVKVLGLDENHLNLEAVLCEGDGCVTLAVPVSFPSPCHDDEMTQCVLDNLNALDDQANDALQQFKWEQDNHEVVGASTRRIQGLKTNAQIQYPSWWVEPTAEIAQECSFLFKLLNEDEFANEIAALARFTMGNQHGLILEGAVLIAVGPAGVVLRVSRKAVSSSAFEVVELPVSFGQVITDSSALRNAVMAGISTATEAVGKASTDNSQPAALPSWWVTPNAEMAQECAAMLSYLNHEDAANEVVALATKAISDLMGEEFDIQETTAVAVGPAGISPR